jgi:hypothetical protein
MSGMRFFKSPQLIVNDVFAWANQLFGGEIPLLPLPPGWGETLRVLWHKYIVGDLPEPGDPMPWRIDIEGTWRPFTSCPARFECMSIVIWQIDEGIPSPANCSPSSPPFPIEEIPPKRARRGVKAKSAATPAKKPRAAPKPKRPAKRPREPAGLLWRTRRLVLRIIKRHQETRRRIS